jgi:hypothetical protein
MMVVVNILTGSEADGKAGKEFFNSKSTAAKPIQRYVAFHGLSSLS